MKKNQKQDNAENGDKLSKKRRVIKSIKGAFSRSARQELKGIFKHTVKDLRKPHEILMLLASCFVPGGWIGYGTYRVTKYKLAKPANDNAQKAAPKKKKQPKPPHNG